MHHCFTDRFSGDVLFTATAPNFGACLRLAIDAGVDPRYIDLSNTDLTGADLSRILLTNALLYGANLTGANLTGANLTRTSFRNACLKGADFTGAYLRRVDLAGADLRGATIDDDTLRQADIVPIRDDIWAVLCALPAEVPALREAIVGGKIDGRVYDGDCACLIGTLANARECSPYSIPWLPVNATRPAETWFLNIRPGDTPESNIFSRLALEWVGEWLERMRVAFGPALQPA